MPIDQIVLYAVIVFFVILYLRKSFQSKSLRQYAPGEVKDKINAKGTDFVLLDVRTGSERAERHIKNSLHIPLNELKARINELNNLKDKEIICYCRSGNRSSTAALLLKKAGFKSANMKGGMLAW
ncbi:MAG: rhodanese-like domain-containing protein [Ignavibacteria bacterium]|jgi:rhodanese-related sulfurtransferase|nr:rhodanese-like domain-containing protein [Ignavibacteria bacterium]MCU7501660.1 rhodanese-like domain-containing protein [Ignavibacteria bacterium]MCU7517751.1 rhodanese-like domain-containing protein [Ignavibacteria bacterium]